MNYSAIFMSFSLRWPLGLSPLCLFFPFHTSCCSVAGKVGKVKGLKGVWVLLGVCVYMFS